MDRTVCASRYQLCAGKGGHIPCECCTHSLGCCLKDISATEIYWPSGSTDFVEPIVIGYNVQLRK